jgi:hypothetical protein
MFHRIHTAKEWIQYFASYWGCLGIYEDGLNLAYGMAERPIRACSQKKFTL